MSPYAAHSSLLAIRLPHWLQAWSAIALVMLVVTGATAQGEQVLPHEDAIWLQRVDFGLNATDLARYQSLGRRRFLNLALAGADTSLPSPIQALIDSYPAINTPVGTLVAQGQQQQAQIKDMPDGDAKIAAKQAYQQQGNQLIQQAQQAELLRAIYGSDSLQEQMVWFWLNHFSIYASKGRVRWLAADYEEHVIRPHALGKFKDLLLATLESPAMLESLDNAQNAKGKVNENYAREVMELHTLGVGSGYSQQDVQQLALILTGAGIAPSDDKPHPLKPVLEALRVRNGLFEFNPARHDFSDKVLLGQPIKGSGFNEITQAIDVIVKQPACAQFIARRLAEYFVADDPPPKLVASMARTFQRSDGDISQVLRTLFKSDEVITLGGRKFKDPTQFVVSAMRLAYDGKPINNARPLLNWLNQLDEPLYGRITPDGWPLDASAWSSSGQLAKRFEIARAIGFGSNQLFTPEGQSQQQGGFPMLTTRPYYTAIEPYLSAATRSALNSAQSQQEWNTFLLSSPDFNYR